VERIYVDVPKHLHQAAANSVRSHLKKLRNDGRVVQRGENWTLTV
jgi:predicted transcriptional regulator